MSIFVTVINLSITMPVPHCLNDYYFLIILEIWQSNIKFF